MAQERNRVIGYFCSQIFHNAARLTFYGDLLRQFFLKFTAESCGEIGQQLLKLLAFTTAGTIFDSQ